MYDRSVGTMPTNIRLSHPYNADTKDVGFSPTRQARWGWEIGGTLNAPRARAFCLARCAGGDGLLLFRRPTAVLGTLENTLRNAPRKFFGKIYGELVWDIDCGSQKVKSHSLNVVIIIVVSVLMAKGGDYCTPLDRQADALPLSCVFSQPPSR